MFNCRGRTSIAGPPAQIRTCAFTHRLLPRMNGVEALIGIGCRTRGQDHGSRRVVDVWISFPEAESPGGVTMPAWSPAVPRFSSVLQMFDSDSVSPMAIRPRTTVRGNSCHGARC